MQGLMIIANIKMDRSDLELISSSNHKTLEDTIVYIEDVTNLQNHKDFGIYTMSDFVDIANNQEIDLDKYWLGYVYCEDNNSQLMVTLEGLCDE